MKARAIFYARFYSDIDALRTIGVVVASKTEILWAPVRGFEAQGSHIEERIADSVFRGLSPDEILGYFVTRSNFVTFSFSNPESVTAPSLNEAAVEMLAKISREQYEVLK